MAGGLIWVKHEKNKLCGCRNYAFAKRKKRVLAVGGMAYILAP